MLMRRALPALRRVTAAPRVPVAAAALWIRLPVAVRSAAPPRHPGPAYSTQQQPSSPYYHNTPAPLDAQPTDMDAPYPDPGADGFVTASFYSFFAIPEPQVGALRGQIQLEWARDLGVVDRVYVCAQGINAQLSVPVDNARALRAWLEAAPALRGRVGPFNWALDHSRAFRALHVRARPLVAAGGELSLDTLAHEPEYLTPAAWDRALRSDRDALVVDMRNTYEFRIGRFEGAVCPDVDTFRDELAAVRAMCEQRGRDAPVYMYCTGGIRCSVAGAMLRADGFTSVKTLQGGVVAYGRHVRDSASQASSLFVGKNFTFDKRRGETVTPAVLATCDQCGAECDTYANCANINCDLLFIQCPSCAEKHRRTCGSAQCIERSQLSHEELIKDRRPPKWPHRERVRPELVIQNGIGRDP
ncbi:hypothetical protein H4S02_001119 [Coemansia sp. RSA 2611]|nr:hypothetical protein IWW54_002505 [Coemansia sp. RSA 2705]KAJ2391836.1 hypothetical protein H4S02_001119 [Coemansia sp. RSA 2611]KAJ2739068.1 hypothetical protein H4R23_000721 [Coemansia sp. Cherry 401B]